MFVNKTEAELKAHNNLDTNKPVVAYMPDWRCVKNENGEVTYHYMEALFNFFKKTIETAGGVIYIVGPTDDYREFQHHIDGIIIPGGRDVHPKFYGEENKGSKLEDDCENRFLFTKEIYENITKEIPILGICWGFQFINVIKGGTLIQHLKNSDAHYKKRRYFFKEGSWFHSKVAPEAIGNCYHHQGLGKIGKDIEIVGVDDNCREPHAIEVHEPGRFIVAVLWHPEATFTDETGDQLDQTNQKIFKAFVDKTKEYKQTK